MPLLSSSASKIEEQDFIMLASHSTRKTAEQKEKLQV